MDQTARISLHHPIMSKSNPKDKIKQRANIPQRNRQTHLQETANQTKPAPRPSENIVPAGEALSSQSKTHTQERKSKKRRFLSSG
jgi:hypothetical protein